MPSSSLIVPKSIVGLLQTNCPSDKKGISTNKNATKAEKEVVMHIDEKDELTFIVLTGKFTDEQLKKLLDGNK